MCCNPLDTLGIDRYLRQTYLLVFFFQSSAKTVNLVSYQITILFQDSNMFTDLFSLASIVVFDLADNGSLHRGEGQ